MVEIVSEASCWLWAAALGTARYLVLVDCCCLLEVWRVVRWVYYRFAAAAAGALGLFEFTVLKAELNWAGLA